MTEHPPIFILGSGKSGTTILYKLLSLHPETYWFSNLVNAHPSYPQLSIFNRLIRMQPFHGRMLTSIQEHASSSVFVEPSEGENIFIQWGFRDDVKTKLIPKAFQITKFRRFIQIQRTCSGGVRFLNKRTANTQRLSPIKQIFPNAYYIHIIRDGRAVADSLIRTSWWKNTPIWWKNGIRPFDMHLTRKSELRLAALHWRHNVQEIFSQCNVPGNKYLQLRYEDFVDNVPESMELILQFCKLSRDHAFLTELPKRLPNMNDAWQRNLSSAEKRMLLSTIGPFLKRIGY